MSAVERLAILITADGQGAIREFTKVGESAERDLGKAETRADRLGKRMTSAGAVMMGASAVMVAGLWNAGQSASNLEQAVGGGEAVFKEHAAGMKAWAEGADKSAGLSTEAALRLSTQMGGALKGLGYDLETAADQSKKNIAIAADLAATYGGTTTEAVEALSAAYRGEFDPAERFNLFLKQSTVDAKAVEMGLAKTTSNVDAYARAQATTALIMEQSSDAQGQFARETDTTAGKAAIAAAEFENAKAALGEGFMPVMQTASSVVSTGAGAFSGLNDATGGLLANLTGVSAVGLGAAGALSFLVGQGIQMRDTFSGLGEKVSGWAEKVSGAAGGTSKLGSAVSSLGYALPIVGVAAVAGIGIWQMYADRQAQAEQRAKEFTDTLDEQTGALTDNTTATVRANLEDNNRSDNLQQAGVSVQEFTDALADNSDAVMSQADVMARWNDGMKGAEQDNAALAASLRDRGGALNELLARLIETGAADEGLIGQIYEQNGAYRENQKLIRDRAVDQAIATGMTVDQAEAEVDAAEAVEAHTQAMKDQNDAQKAMFDPLFAATDALEKNRDALAAAEKASGEVFFAQLAYNQAVAEHGPVSAEALKAQQDLNQAVEAADDANRTTARSAMDVDQATRTLSAALNDGTIKWDEARGTLDRWVAQGLITEDQARKVAGELFEVASKAYSIPRDTFTTAHADVGGAISAFDSLLETLRNVPRWAKITMDGEVRTVTSVGVTAPAGLPSFYAPNKASGGPVAAGSMYTVFDTSHPEILETPSARYLLTGDEPGKVTNLGLSAATSPRREPPQRMAAPADGRPLVVQLMLDSTELGRVAVSGVLAKTRGES